MWRNLLLWLQCWDKKKGNKYKNIFLQNWKGYKIVIIKIKHIRDVTLHYNIPISAAFQQYTCRNVIMFCVIYQYKGNYFAYNNRISLSFFKMFLTCIIVCYKFSKVCSTLGHHVLPSFPLTTFWALSSPCYFTNYCIDALWFSKEMNN